MCTYIHVGDYIHMQWLQHNKISHLEAAIAGSWRLAPKWNEIQPVMPV